MSASRPIISDGGLLRSLNPGDIFCLAEPPVPATDTTNTTFSYTAAMFVGNTVYVRTPAGVSTDTYPTADALIQALLASNPGFTTIPQGLSFRFRIINLSANLLTGAVTANTGVTMVRGNVPASTTKDFLIQITNGSPAYIATNLSTTSSSAVVTGFTAEMLKNISVGMVVTNAVANLQGQTVIGVNLAAGSVTFSGNANATATGSTINLSGTYTITGLAA